MTFHWWEWVTVACDCFVGAYVFWLLDMWSNEE